MRFGLEGRRELTQKEVAQKMGISQSYISRLEKRIMLRLKKEFLRQTSCAVFLESVWYNDKRIIDDDSVSIIIRGYYGREESFQIGSKNACRGIWRT